MHRATRFTLPLLGGLILGSLVTAQQFHDLGSGYAFGVSQDGHHVTGSGPGGGFVWNAVTGMTTIGENPVAISGDGSFVAGDMSLSPGEAGIWNAGTGWVNLGGITGGGPCSGTLSSAYDISADGTIAVGLAWDGCTAARAFYWNGFGMTVLPAAGGGGSARANTVSDDGLWVGGWERDSTSQNRAVLWDANTWLAQLIAVTPSNPNGYGEVYDVAPNGSAATGGEAYANPFLWTAAGGYQDLGPVPGMTGEQGFGYGLTDDADLVVGSAGSFFAGYAAFAWTKEDGMRLLSDFVADQNVTVPPTAQLSNAQDVSGDGRVIIGMGGSPPFLSAWVIELPGWTRYSLNASPVNSLDLDGGGSVALGGSLDITVSNVAGSTAFTALSTESANFPIRGGVGLINPGATQLLSIDVHLAAGGVANHSYTIPSAPAFVGFSAYLQSFAPDASKPFGYALSNGLKVVLTQ